MRHSMSCSRFLHHPFFKNSARLEEIKTWKPSDFSWRSKLIEVKGWQIIILECWICVYTLESGGFICCFVSWTFFLVFHAVTQIMVLGMFFCTHYKKVTAEGTLNFQFTWPTLALKAVSDLATPIHLNCKPSTLLYSHTVSGPSPPWDAHTNEVWESVLQQIVHKLSSRGLELVLA